MASMATTLMRIPSSEFKQHIPISNQFYVTSCHSHVLTCQNSRSINYCYIQHYLSWRSFSCNPHRQGLRRLSKPISASGSGLEASITDPKGNAITLKNAKIVVESQDGNKIQLRVDLTGDETQKVFDKVLSNLARTAPPVPGFRRQKGGKSSMVPKSFLLQMLGEERVTNFVLQEIVNSTMADYVNKENLNVKEKKINTTQTAEELKLSFTPGNEFGFNAVVELENSDIEKSS